MDHANWHGIMMLVKKIIFFGAMVFAVYSLYNADKQKRLRDLTRASMAHLPAVKETPAPEKVGEQHERFMKRALEISKSSKPAAHEVPAGSVVVQDGKIIGEGWDDRNLLKDPEAHAEVRSIINACKTLSNCDLRGTHIYASVQPCPTCLSIISTAGIKKVYYCIPRTNVTAAETLAKRRIENEVQEVQVLAGEAERLLSEHGEQ